MRRILTEAEDAAAADLEPCLFDGMNRGNVGLVVVGCAYLREKASRRLQVMVVGFDPGVFQSAGGLEIDDSQRAGWGNAGFRSDPLCPAADGVQFSALADGGTAGNNAVAGGPLLLGFFSLQRRCCLHRREDTLGQRWYGVQTGRRKRSFRDICLILH